MRDEPSLNVIDSASSNGTTVGLLGMLLIGFGCSDDPQPSAPPAGPPGGMIEVDAGSSGGWGVGGTGAGGSGGSGQLLNGGIGQICDVDSDCPSGLTCNIDTVDWIAHRQCSIFCDTSDFCEAEYGNHTMCIGANLCVSKCLDDTDCPANTVCNSNDWCANTGPGSGVPKCSGTPTPCSLLGEFDCTSSLGCNWNGNCSGVASSCYSQYDSYSCSSQDGCYWSSSSSSCSGVSASCSSMFSDYSCTSQDGCYWSGDCTGTPYESTCEDIPASLCTYTPGCVLVPQP